ncbi:MAG: MFS transporter [Kordiimonadaceae bacterium]|nr:MFS transporter [Kordiimonadaceae bacterium]MBO6567493.1 MFS transporter [Kordiimonadaceae bacterium]MBO6963293.1 MFS transporter [Kordiimonadaceae bacterium]
MSDTGAFATAPEDRIPVLQRVIYGAGAFVNNLLAGSIGAMMIVLNLGLGMNPALVGLLGMLPRLFDAITDPLMGYISDNTKSRWGRRRPYIFIGAIGVGLAYMFLWQLPRGESESYLFWYFLFGSLIFFLAYTIFATPWVALGYEMTPDYNERTRLMGTQFFIGQFAYFVYPWLLLIMQDETMFDDMVDGAASVGLVIGLFAIVFGMLPALFLRERIAITPESTNEPVEVEGQSKWQAMSSNVSGFVTGFVTTLKFMPFLKLCLATFLIFNGFQLVAAIQTYVIIYYIFAGDTALGAEYFGYVGTAMTASTFAIIVFVTWLGTKIGKRRAFAISTILSMIGFGLKWFCYTPDNPWLVLIPAPLIAFGYGGLFTLMPSMMADVVDMDELNTGERREGMYGSIYWWVVKLGQAAALAGGGILLNVSGFDVELGGNQTEETLTLLRLFDAFIPLLASGFAIWCVASFGITQEKAREVREKLESIRGKLNPAAA